MSSTSPSSPASPFLVGLLQIVQRHVQRVWNSDLTRNDASPEEQQKLASAETPLTDPHVQTFAVWRRSMLWISAACMAGWFIGELATYQDFAATIAEQQLLAAPEYQQASASQQRELRRQAAAEVTEAFGSGNLETLNFPDLALMLSHLIGTLFILRAAISWSDLRKSIRLARIGWLILFLTPFIISLIPITRILDFERIADPQQRQAAQMGVGVLFALGFAATVGPKILSLIPGIVRSVLSLKTLLPESAALGWIVLLFVPFYPLLLVVAAQIVIQTMGDLEILIGVIVLMIAPLNYLRHSESLIQPQNSEAARELIPALRRSVAVLSFIGAVLVGHGILKHAQIPTDYVVRFCLGFIASMLVLTVVSADFVLKIFAGGYRQQQTWQESDNHDRLAERLAALASAGVISAAEFTPAAEPAAT